MRTSFRNAIPLALLLLALPLSACGSTVANDPESYNGGWWREHMHDYLAVIKRDVKDFYRTFDRHVMDYDWDDPYLD